MVVLFIILDWIFVLMNTVAMILCRHVSEEVGHAPNCIMGQHHTVLQFTRSLMPFGAPERRPKIR